MRIILLISLLIIGFTSIAQTKKIDAKTNSTFKSYDELNAKLMSTIGAGVEEQDQPRQVSVPTAETTDTQEEFSAVFDKPSTSSSTDDDDLEDYFKSLAAD